MVTSKSTFIAAFALGATLFMGCDRGGSSTPPPDRLSPPTDTGTVVIDMNGRWRVTEVRILEQLAHNGERGKPQANSGLYPVTVGTIVTIEDGIFTRADGYPMVPKNDPTIEVYTYLNQTDGRFGLYDLGSRSRPDPRIADGGDSRAQLVVGSIDHNTMSGLSAFAVFAAPFPDDQPYMGLYTVRLERQ